MDRLERLESDYDDMRRRWGGRVAVPYTDKQVDAWNAYVAQLRDADKEYRLTMTEGVPVDTIAGIEELYGEGS